MTEYENGDACPVCESTKRRLVSATGSDPVVHRYACLDCERWPPWLYGERWAAIDIETTGVDIASDRIVQIAVVQIDGGKIVDSWSSLVNPERPIPEAATAVHGITDADVADAKPFHEVIGALVRACAGRTLLGYNAAHFDVPFIRSELRRYGRPTSERQPLDPLIWIREIDRFVKGSGRHKLTATCERWGVPLEGAHHALHDAEATWCLWKKIVDRESDRFATRIEDVLAEQARLAVEQEKNFNEYKARQSKEATR